MLNVLLSVVLWIHTGYSLPEKGLCAHRGAMETHPENTIPAFKEAIRLGTQMIEFDLRMTKDSVLVLMHDETVDRTTDGSGKVGDLTFAEIRRLDAGSFKGLQFKGTKVPTFEEALAVMPRNVWLNCHLKGGSAAGIAAAKIIKKANRLHQAFLACGEAAAQAAREIDPKILICNMEDRFRKNNDAYVSSTVDMKANFIQMLRKGVISKEHIGILKKNGVRINYFQAHEPSELAALLDAGIDFVLVNDPAAFATTAQSAGILPVKPKF
jgi:glycerophosphoryl diester phosphodiesterase